MDKWGPVDWGLFVTGALIGASVALRVLKTIASEYLDWRARRQVTKELKAQERQRKAQEQALEDLVKFAKSVFGDPDKDGRNPRRPGEPEERKDETGELP